jgi:hypothetical protein
MTIWARTIRSGRSMTPACAEAFCTGTGRSPSPSPPVVAGTLLGRPEAVAHDNHVTGGASANRATATWAGALAVIRYAKIHGTGHRPWLTALLARRPTKVAAIALANKIARDGLGHDGQGRALQTTRSTCALNEIASYNRCDVKVGRPNRRNAEPVDPAIRTTHLCHRIIECVLLTGT